MKALSHCLVKLYEILEGYFDKLLQLILETQELNYRSTPEHGYKIIARRVHSKFVDL